MNAVRTGQMLYYCAGSLVDHADPECPRLRRRVQDRQKPRIFGKRAQRGDRIPLCPVCAS